jgi:hypothetical protein
MSAPEQNAPPAPVITVRAPRGLSPPRERIMQGDPQVEVDCVLAAWTVESQRPHAVAVITQQHRFVGHH